MYLPKHSAETNGRFVGVSSIYVLLVKMLRGRWYTIYHHKTYRGKQAPFFINQPNCVKIWVVASNYLIMET